MQRHYFTIVLLLLCLEELVSRLIPNDTDFYNLRVFPFLSNFALLVSSIGYLVIQKKMCRTNKIALRLFIFLYTTAMVSLLSTNKILIEITEYTDFIVLIIMLIFVVRGLTMNKYGTL